MGGPRTRSLNRKKRRAEWARRERLSPLPTIPPSPLRSLASRPDVRSTQYTARPTGCVSADNALFRANRLIQITILNQISCLSPLICYSRQLMSVTIIWLPICSKIAVFRVLMLTKRCFALKACFLGLFSHKSRE